MQDYQFTVAVGASQPMQVVGSYVRYQRCTAGSANPSIRINVPGYGKTKLAPSEAARWPKEFSSFYIENADGVATVSGEIVVSDGSFQSDRIGGEVSVIDGSKSRTLAGQAFIGQWGANAVAAQYAHMQLLNPSGSGKRVVITQYKGISNALCSFQLIRYDTALTTLNGNAPSKDIAAAASTAQLRSATNAAQLGTGSVMDSSYFPAAGMAPSFVFREPIILRANQGIVLRSDTVNTLVSGVFEFYEESDV